jgi:hypothetical protein
MFSKSLSPRPAPKREPELVAVKGELADAAAALAADVLYSARALAALDEAPRKEWLARRAELARSIAAGIVEHREAPSPVELTARARLHWEELRAMPGAGLGRPLPRRLHDMPRDRLWRVGEALREQALEHLGSELMLGLRPGAELVAATGPVADAQAHVWLLGSLYDKVEAWVAEYPPAAMEREAARWWLSRWRAPRPPKADEFAGVVREQEFSLVSRNSVILGVSPLEYMVDDRLLEEAGPKQWHMAQRLLESFAGVWTVDSRAGDTATFRDPLGGGRYRVREHAPEQQYGAGSMVLGRLIPFGDGTWLRSPGSLIVPEQGAGPGMARDFAAGMARAAEDMYPEAVVEGTISVLLRTKGIPRAVRPAVSPDAAALLGRDLHFALQAVGAAREETDPSQVPESLRGVPGTTVMSLEVDVVLAEYLQALIEHAKKGKLMRQTQRRREREAKKRKGRR